MKHHCLFLLGAMVASWWAPLAEAATRAEPKMPGPPPLSPRFLQVRDRINTLFQHRNDAPPAPDLRANPFRPAGSAATPVGGPAPGAPPPELPGNDLALLQQAVATLKVSGTFERADQMYVVVNSRPYKKNEVIQSRAEGQPVYLRVREITRNTVTLALNDTELALKF